MLTITIVIITIEHEGLPWFHGIFMGIYLNMCNDSTVYQPNMSIWVCLKKGYNHGSFNGHNANTSWTLLVYFYSMNPNMGGENFMPISAMIIDHDNFRWLIKPDPCCIFNEKSHGFLARPIQGSHSAIADRADIEIDNVRKQGVGKSTVLGDNQPPKTRSTRIKAYPVVTNINFQKIDRLAGTCVLLSGMLSGIIITPFPMSQYVTQDGTAGEPMVITAVFLMMFYEQSPHWIMMSW